MLIKVNCNLCGGNNFKVLRSVIISPLGGKSELVKCNECGLVYINPRYDEEEEKRFYASEYFENGRIESWREERAKIFKHGLNIIEARKKNGRLLDIGCGMGMFLKIAKDNGWNVFGIDISKSAIEYARRIFDLEITESTLKDANFSGGYFDVVTAWNTIDQLNDPLNELKEIYRILKKDGILAIRVSNIRFHIIFDSALKSISVIRYMCNYLEKPAVFHNYMFSRETATAMLRKVGFSNTKILNSSLSLRNGIVKEIIYLICQTIYYLTFKRCIMTPSLLILAEKG